jgi:hypothetical protein
MANEEHLKILKQGMDVWNQWRIQNHSVVPNLREAFIYHVNLRGANLNDADLVKAHLSRSDLSRANLWRAHLRGAYLNSADLSGANLSKADLSGANLRGANLAEANLTGANLTEADLSGADLYRARLSEANLLRCDMSRARVGWTIFADIDLSVAEGLDSINHTGPSTIGLDTIHRSNGKIPDAFLRNAGVLDDFIQYLPSLVGKPFDFYSCFISYSHMDEEFAKRLHSRMRDEHLRVWYAPEDIKGGEKLHEQIDVAIRVYDKLLIVLSDNSLQSEWVKTELRKAHKVEIREKRRKLFPIRLVDFETIQNWECFDADTGKDLAVELREYFIPDFSNWKNHDAFEAAFMGLLKDLRADAKKVRR